MRTFAVAVSAMCMVAVTATGAVAAPSRVPGASDKKVVTIGVIAPLEAGLTSFGQGIRDSVELAVKQANDANAVPGWTIKVRALDDSSDPVKGARAARKLANDPSVVAVVGPYNSGVAEQALPVLSKAGLALLSPSNTLTSLTQGDDPAKPVRPYDTYFRLVGTDALQAVFLAERARAEGFAIAAVVSETKAVSKDLADRFDAAFAKEGGATSVRKTVPDGATSDQFAEFIAAVAQTDPDVMFFGGEYNVAAGLRNASFEAGVRAPLMGGDGINDAAYVAGTGQAGDGSFASGVGVPIETLPGADDFLAAYTAAGFTTDPTDYGPYAYDAANATVAVLKSVLKGRSSIPSDARSKVVAGIQATDTAGLTGQIAFDRYGDTRDPRFTLYRVQGAPPSWVSLPAT